MILEQACKCTAGKLSPLIGIKDFGNAIVTYSIGYCIACCSTSFLSSISAIPFCYCIWFYVKAWHPVPALRVIYSRHTESSRCAFEVGGTQLAQFLF
jgi:hypothetical protein